MSEDKPKQIIFMAELVDGKISVTINSKVLPMVAYASKILDFEINKNILDQHIANSKSDLIVRPGNNGSGIRQGLKNFLRGK